MADLSAYLSPADRAKLARQVGITLDDGRQFRRGVMVSAQDAANSAATGARNAAFAAQTGQYGDRSGTIDANKVGAQAYEAYLANPRSVGIAQSAPQPAAAPAGAPNAAQPAAPQAGAPAPADDLLNRARLMAQYQGSQGAAPAAPVPTPGFQMAAGPNISTAPTGLPQGSIGMQRANGQYTVEAPMGPGIGTQTFGGEQQAQQAFAGMPSFAPQPAPAPPAPMQAPAQPSAPAAPVAGFLPGGGGYTPQQITAMSPQQRSALVAFNAETEAKKQAQQQADLEAKKTKAEIAATRAKTQRGPELSFQEQNVAAQIAAREASLGRALNTQERADVFNQVSSAASPTGNPNDRLRADSVKARIDEERTAYKNANAAAAFAKQTEQALAAGASAGSFAKVKGYVKNLAESVTGEDFGAAEQITAERGLAGLQAAGVRAIMQGLGSMSNADREFATASLPSITDAQKSVQFYVELAKENAKLAKQDAAFIRKLERENVDQAEIYRQLDEMRDERNVAEDIYNRVIGGNSQAPATQGSVPSVGQSQPARVRKYNPATRSLE